ncbi:MAG TPA: hypothetical protein VL574_13115 [Stellaceae bacterium]|nr:hypothetical protein [Stellaceae bacterium]
MVGLFSLSIATALADDPSLIVVSATNAKFQPGDKVPATQSLTLAAGQSVTLIAADGSVTTLNGPFTGAPTAAATAKTASVTDMLSPLLKKAATEQATPGVIRGTGDQATAAALASGNVATGPDTDPWVIDSSHGGDVCIHQAVEYDMWRPNASQPATLTLAPVGGKADQATSLQFKGGTSRVGVPDSVIFKDGGQYKITGPNGSETITVHTIPETVPATNKITAAWFLQKHCQVQAEALAKWLVSSN